MNLEGEVVFARADTSGAKNTIRLTGHLRSPQRERERLSCFAQKWSPQVGTKCAHIYIYIYIYRARDPRIYSLPVNMRGPLDPHVLLTS